jgi:DNA-binding LacI/PurR family transcriptional regulator
VVVDDHDGSFKAVEHLVKTGCTKIAYIGGPENLFISNQRLQGYRDALQQHGIQIHEEYIIHCKDLHTDPVKATQYLLELPAPPDAIFCFNDPVAIMALQVLKERSVSVPDTVSVVGFTNEPVSRFIEPSLTTVAQPAYEMGQIAARLFIQEMENKDVYVPVTRILKTELIIRNSTRKI